MTIGLEHYLFVSALLFCIGLFGVVLRRSLLVIYMSLELMLNAANLALVAFSRFNNNLDGQVLVFFIITVFPLLLFLSRCSGLVVVVAWLSKILFCRIPTMRP